MTDRQKLGYSILTKYFGFIYLNQTVTSAPYLPVFFQAISWKFIYFKFLVEIHINKNQPARKLGLRNPWNGISLLSSSSSLDGAELYIDSLEAVLDDNVIIV